MPSQARGGDPGGATPAPLRGPTGPLPARAQRFVAPVEGLNRFEDRSRFVVLQVPFDDGTAELARRDPEGLRLPDEFGKRLSGEPEANCHVLTSPTHRSGLRR